MPLLVIILSGMSVRTHCLTAHCLVLYGSFFLLHFFGGSAYPCLFFFAELTILQPSATSSVQATIGYFSYYLCIENPKVTISISIFSFRLYLQGIMHNNFPIQNHHLQYTIPHYTVLYHQHRKPKLIQVLISLFYSQ